MSVNDGRADVFALQQAITTTALDDPAHLVGESLSFYDGDPPSPEAAPFLAFRSAKSATMAR